MYELVNKSNKLVQIIGSVSNDKSILLYIIANFYLGLSKTVIFVNYSSKITKKRLSRKYKKNGLNLLMSNNFILCNNTSLDSITEQLSKVEINENDLIIIIDDIEYLSYKNVESPLKQSLYYTIILKKLQLFSDKIFISNNSYENDNKIKSSINIKVDYQYYLNSINIEESINDFKITRRKCIIDEI